MFFGAADVATQRRLSSNGTGSMAVEQRREHALALVERYVHAVQCRQRMLCAHFTGTEDDRVCSACDVCLDAETVREGLVHATANPPKPLAESLAAGEHDLIVAAVSRLRRPVGKSSLAKALRGSRAKSLSRGGLLTLPEYGALAHHSEASIVAAVDALLIGGRLARFGRKYPTVWIPGRPVRTAKVVTEATDRSTARSGRPRVGPVARALDAYRQQMARTLKWKPYMVFQRRVIVAIDRQRPDSPAALARIPGLGPAKIERFGPDILALVRRHGAEG
jgi:ATP-dependent DNA helicase RecQ